MGKEINEEVREEALTLLNQATEDWKKTGELKTNVGKPPVPIKTRLMSLFAKIRPSFKTAALIKAEKKEENKDREEIESLIQQLNQVYSKSPGQGNNL